MIKKSTLMTQSWLSKLTLVTISVVTSYHIEFHPCSHPQIPTPPLMEKS